MTARYLSGPPGRWGQGEEEGEKASGGGAGDGLLHDVVRKVITQILDIAALLRENGDRSPSA